MKKIKLQCYLRGLGVGMVITAVIMGAVLPGEGKELSDAQIKQRALELGMVDESSLMLSDLQTEPSLNPETESMEVVETTQEQSKEQTEDAMQTESIDAETQEPEMNDIETEEEALAQEQVEQLEEEVSVEDITENVNNETENLTSQPRVNGAINAEGNTVTVEIHSGANSYSVSKILQDTGLVADAKAYDRFLCNGGYSKRIHTGTYLIAVGTSEEEIAKIITGNR